MPSTAPRLLEPAQPALALPAHPVRGHDAHDEDRIDYGAWLLPPADLDRGEQLIQTASKAAGIVAMLAGSAAALAIIF